MNLFLTTGNNEFMAMWTPLLFIGIMFVALYFMSIRPEKKKTQALVAMRESLKIGDNVTTIGGIVGTVCNVKSDKVVIETGADQVRIELMKWAISSNESAEARKDNAKSTKSSAEK